MQIGTAWHQFLCRIEGEDERSYENPPSSKLNRLGDATVMPEILFGDSSRFPREGVMQLTHVNPERIVTALIVAAFIAGCAPTSQLPTVDEGLARAEAHKQRMEATAAHVENLRRLHDVSFHILKSNVELCGKKVRHFGGYAGFTLDQMDKEWRDSMRLQFGVGNRVTIFGVGRDSPAQRAGLRPRDKIHRVNGTDIGTGKRAFQRLGKALKKNGSNPTDLTIDRDGQSLELTITPVLSCDYPVVIVQDDRVNAYADGTKVAISAGMIRFTESDDELALIIGHELAHNTRGHIDAKRGNVLLGGIIGALATGLTGVRMTDIGQQAGAAAFSQEFEAEADYVGVYHAARAGYTVEKAAEFWRRMARIHPQAINLAGSTHPSTAKRFLAVQAASSEVERKRVAGQPLIPEER